MTPSEIVMGVLSTSSVSIGSRAACCWTDCEKRTVEAGMHVQDYKGMSSGYQPALALHSPVRRATAVILSAADLPGCPKSFSNSPIAQRCPEALSWPSFASQLVLVNFSQPTPVDLEASINVGLLQAHVRRRM